MGKKKVEGFCRVCGDFGPLSEEHVPPKRAFNDMPYIELSFDQTMKLGPEDVPEGPKRQGGIRFHSLCRQCNNDFGSWYASTFVKWCYQGMDILERSGGHPRLAYAHHIYPLRVLKQIIAMFFSVNNWEFRETAVGKELAWLLRNREEKGLPPGVRFYAYFNREGRLRYNPVVTVSKIFEGKVSVFSEITYPPFGYIMAIDSEPPDDRLFDVTHFAWSDYHQTRSEFLHLPVLPTYMPGASGDYRNLEDIIGQGRRSELFAEESDQKFDLSNADRIRLLGDLGRALEIHHRWRGN